jgi:mono/diheme cytochrome c family protein
MAKKIQGLALIAFVAFGLAACGGESADDASAMAETAEAQAAVVTADAADTEMAATDAMPQELPEGVTPAMVEEGKGVYSGAGICMSCHGPNGEGIPNLGANLTDDEWIHIDGSYESIVQNILNGVTAQESSSGVPMPARGGASITDEQGQAVAAYVWTLSK